MARKGGAPENLDPVKSKEEAKKRGRNGGIRSGQVRRAKRDCQEMMKRLLDMPVTSKMTQDNLKKLAVSEEDFTNRAAILARAVVLAISGDVNAMKFVVEVSGETPRQKLDQARFDNEVGQQEGKNNAVDDWVSSIPDVVTEEDDSDDGAAEKA